MRWLSLRFKCLKNDWSKSCCSQASDIIHTHLSYSFLFLMEFARSPKKKKKYVPGSLEWLAHQLLNLFTHFKHGGYCVWKYKAWGFSFVLNSNNISKTPKQNKCYMDACSDAYFKCSDLMLASCFIFRFCQHGLGMWITKSLSGTRENQRKERWCGQTSM